MSFLEVGSTVKLCAWMHFPWISSDNMSENHSKGERALEL